MLNIVKSYKYYPYILLKGAFSLNLKLRNGDESYENFLGNLPQNPQIVERRKFRQERRVHRKISVRNFQTFWRGSFPEMVENTVTFVARNLRKLKSGIFHRMESAQISDLSHCFLPKFRPYIARPNSPHMLRKRAKWYEIGTNTSRYLVPMQSIVNLGPGPGCSKAG